MPNESIQFVVETGVPPHYLEAMLARFPMLTKLVDRRSGLMLRIQPWPMPLLDTGLYLERCVWEIEVTTQLTTENLEFDNSRSSSPSSGNQLSFREICWIRNDHSFEETENSRSLSYLLGDTELDFDSIAYVVLVSTRIGTINASVKLVILANEGQLRAFHDLSVNEAKAIFDPQETE